MCPLGIFLLIMCNLGKQGIFTVRCNSILPVPNWTFVLIYDRSQGNKNLRYNLSNFCEKNCMFFILFTYIATLHYIHLVCSIYVFFLYLLHYFPTSHLKPY